MKIQLSKLKRLELIDKLRRYRVLAPEVDRLRAEGNWNSVDVIRMRYNERLAAKLGKTVYVKFKPLSDLDVRALFLNLGMPWFGTSEYPFCKSAYWPLSNKVRFRNHVEFIKHRRELNILGLGKGFIETEKVDGDYLSDLYVAAAKKKDFSEVSEYSKLVGRELRKLHEDGWGFCDPNPYDLIWDSKRKKIIFTDGDNARRLVVCPHFTRNFELTFCYYGIAKLLAHSTYKILRREELRECFEYHARGLLAGYGDAPGLNHTSLRTIPKFFMGLGWLLANYVVIHFRTVWNASYGFRRAYFALRKAWREQAGK